MAPADGTPSALPVTEDRAADVRSAAWADKRPWERVRAMAQPRSDRLSGPRGEHDSPGGDRSG
eukprot:7764312-Alexandrium_andersonii.AAC.1